MIAFIRGNLEEINENSVIIETQGIAYEINMHRRAIASLPQNGQPVKVYTHFQVMENEFKLYGFSLKEEQSLFRLLLTVSGMGAKGAMNVLETMEPDQFYRAIASQDEKLLTTIPGIGKKSAQRLIFELKEKIGETRVTAAAPGEEPWLGDVMDALEALGYLRSEMFPLIMDLRAQGKLMDRVEDNIKLVLKTRAMQLKR
ncbi:MAG: Holliday junction branch migration protein RuvA [Deltaproteobacteria bacterium]